MAMYVYTLNAQSNLHTTAYLDYFEENQGTSKDSRNFQHTAYTSRKPIL